MQTKTQANEITSRIASKDAELQRIAGLASKCSADRASKQASLTSKRNAVAAATTVLADVRVAEALGTPSAGTEADAVAALAAAQKALAAESKADGDINVLMAQEVAIGARLAAIQAELAELHIDRKKLFIDAQAAELPTLIAAYTALAPQTMQALGEAYALHLHLSSIGRDPGLFSPGLHESQLGSFFGSPLPTDMGEVVARERLRLSAEALGA